MLDMTCIHGRADEAQCSVCTPPANQVRIDWIEAKYPGVCAECRWEIDVGDRITGGDDAGWVHIECS